MNDTMNLREFERFPIQLTIQVSATDSFGEKYDETTELIQISGGGARFISCQAERYFIGQILEITIDMPGKAEVKAIMRGPATVLRVEPLGPSGNMGKDRLGMYIAVKFNDRLRFIRD